MRQSSVASLMSAGGFDDEDEGSVEAFNAARDVPMLAKVGTGLALATVSEGRGD